MLVPMTPRDADVHAGQYGGGGPPGYGGPPPGYGGPPPGGYGPPPGQPPQPPGYPPAGGYGPPPMFGPPAFGPGGFAPPGPSGQMETLAIISLVLGLLSLPGGCCCSILVMPVSIGGGVCGFIAMNNIQKSGGYLGGKPLAIAGIVCSGISILLAITRLVLGFGMLATQFFK